jgi:lysophospholipase L1-like esterase
VLRPPSLSLAAVLVAGVLTGCSEDEPRTYVAIGDSYTAAPQIGSPDGRDGCFRSRNNYPHLVAKEAGLELEDVSCASARTADVEGSQRTPLGAVLPPQIDALDDETDLVTIRIGANDFNLAGRVIIDCLQLARRDRTGSPCTEADAEAGDESVAARLDDVQRNVEGVIEAVRKRAPAAQVLVVGYPQIFPAVGGCDALPLPEGDLAFARRVNEGIDQTLADAADATGVEFVDVFAATEGHDICAEDSWIAGATPQDGRKAQPFHPYAEEQAHTAELVLAAIE